MSSIMLVTVRKKKIFFSFFNNCKFDYFVATDFSLTCNFSRTTTLCSNCDYVPPTQVNSNSGSPRIPLTIVIVITSSLTKLPRPEDAKGTFGLRIKLSPTHLCATHGGGFTRFLLMLNVRQGSCEY